MIKKIFAGFVISMAILLWAPILPTWIPGYDIGIVVGQSMVPTLNEGDWIFLKNPKDITELKEGMVITYDINPIWRGDDDIGIIHRIIEIDGETLRTKGDNNLCPDPWQVQFEDVRGVYLFHIPHIGHLVLHVVNVREFLLNKIK